jgi:hypothetical protein
MSGEEQTSRKGRPPTRPRCASGPAGWYSIPRANTPLSGRRLQRGAPVDAGRVGNWELDGVISHGFAWVDTPEKDF